MDGRKGAAYLRGMENRSAVQNMAVAGGDISVSVERGIGTIRFSHPKGNSLPGALLRYLARTIEGVGQHPDVRVIVLRSDGSGPFCAGASFDELVSIATPDEGEVFFSGFAQVILAMIRAPQFVLVRVHGKTAGGGIGIAAAGDYTFAVQNASAKLSELAVGIGPFVVGPVISRRIGLGPFMAMSVDADWRDSAWCERHGLYARVFDDAAAMDAAIDALATTLAASNPKAMRLMKGVAWSGTETWESLLAERARMSGTLVLSDFTRAAIAKFKGK
jgi:methylglutaconyl-CoA hydratase